MTTIKGNDILLLLGGTAVAGAKSCEIETECDIIEVSSPASGTARNFIPGRTSWNTNCTFLVKSFAVPLLKAGTVVGVKIGKATSGTRTLSTDKLEGSAIIQSCKITATRGNLAQGSFKLQGTGTLV